MEPTATPFETLEADTRSKVLNYLNRFVGPVEAEDLAQEVFLKVHAGLDRFRGGSKASTWVFQIATHAALDYLKSASHRASRNHLSETILNPDTFLVSAGHDQLLVKEEMCQCIQGLVDDLPLDHRTIIYLIELKELGLGEVAEILGITPGAAKIRLHRARKLLRTRMEQHCRILLDEDADIQCDRVIVPSFEV